MSFYDRPDSSPAIERALQAMEAAAKRIAQSFGPHAAQPYRGNWVDVTPVLRMLRERGPVQRAALDKIGGDAPEGQTAPCRHDTSPDVEAAPSASGAPCGDTDVENH